MGGARGVAVQQEAASSSSIAGGPGMCGRDDESLQEWRGPQPGGCPLPGSAQSATAAGAYSPEPRNQSTSPAPLSAAGAETIASLMPSPLVSPEASTE